MGVQISDLFLEFLMNNNSGSFDDWVLFCNENINSNKVDIAVSEIKNKCNELARIANSVTEDEIRKWIEDLLYVKTFNGLNIQHVILSKIASLKNTTYIKATKEDESKGIDGYINGVPYSVKPKSYYIQNPSLVEWIDAVMIFYDKTKRGLSLEIYKN